MNMRGAALTKQGSPLEMREFPIPEPGRNQLLAHITRCGICHSDLHIIDGDWPIEHSLPLIIGHEGVGKVVGAGDGVTGWKTGDRVGVPLINRACGQCEWCRDGVETLCESIVLTGYDMDGCFAEYVLIDADFAVPLPDGISDDKLAPILCAGVTVFRGIRQSDLRPGEWLAIWGIGGLGHLAVQYAKAMGIRVIAVDVDAAKLALAEKMGADLGVDARNDPVGAIQKHCNGAHGALVTAASVPAFQDAYAALRPNGRFTPLGIPSGDFSVSIPDLLGRQIRIKGSSVGTREDMRDCLSFVADRRVDSEIELFSFDDINNAIERLRTGRISGRAVVSIS